MELLPAVFRVQFKAQIRFCNSVLEKMYHFKLSTSD